MKTENVDRVCPFKGIVISTALIIEFESAIN